MVQRRMPVGAEVQREGGVHFRVWAPRRRRVEVIVYRAAAAERGEVACELTPTEGGYFEGSVERAAAGTLYRYRLDGGGAFPDPASRFQPLGPHGPSQVVDPDDFNWSDDDWRGVRAVGQVLYEMHVGTFTPEGTWAAAAEQLGELKSLGVTVIELMPVAEFPGRFGWGYDGVDLYAPTRLYGEPDDLRRFVDRAHAAGLGVILDVVYNHLGPDGNYLKEYAGSYFTDRYKTEWGEPLHFEGDDAAPVRELFAENAAYWVREFHLDGLRLDATQNIYDNGSPEHILAAITRRARDAAGERAVLVVGENEPQHARLIRPSEKGGFGLDALWNDDFHHTAMVALTGRREAYYTDYLGTPQEFVSAAKWGYLYQGQRYWWQQHRRGTPTLDVPARAFVTFLQNHDQVANSGRGERVHRLTSPGRLRALTALLLLGPGTPMLFQGQEFAASAPFLFFADHSRELAPKVYSGRKQFLAQFRSLRTPAAQAAMPDPSDPCTFERCKLDLTERERHAPAYEMHRDLLRLRRDDPAFGGAVDGAVLGTQAFVLRFFGANAADADAHRLLVVNLGGDLRLAVAPEPLLAPPLDMHWRVLWSSEDVRYGGHGTPPLETDKGWLIPGESAVALAPAPGTDLARAIDVDIDSRDSQRV